jgi:hypothetical protein
MSAPKSAQCIFMPCSGKDWKKCKKKGLETIIRISKDKGDRYHGAIQDKISRASETDSDLFLWCHKSCYSTYTSSSRNDYSPAPPKKGKKRPASCPAPGERLLKSQVPSFTRDDFKSKCFLCTQQCQPKDPKNPKRWRNWRTCEKETLERLRKEQISLES